MVDATLQVHLDGSTGSLENSESLLLPLGSGSEDSGVIQICGIRAEYISLFTLSGSGPVWHGLKRVGSDMLCAGQ